MNDLQNLINQKARARAVKEVNAFIELIKKDKNIWEVISTWKIVLDGESRGLMAMDTFFYGINSSGPQALIDSLTNLYIPEESQRFMNKVDKLPHSKV